MFDIGGFEMLLLIVVTLLVVGPKDLPKVIRGFARTIARLRRMVDEFMGSVNDYVRESELSEFKDAVDKTRKAMDVRGHLDDLMDQTQDVKPPAKPAPESPGPQVEKVEPIDPFEDHGTPDAPEGGSPASDDKKPGPAS